MIAVIDNYDSFTFNLVQILRTFREDIRVFRNDELTVEELSRREPDGILISPGPGHPKSSGISCDVILHFAGQIPILGVCLGHQAIASVFGGQIIQAQRIVHGKTSLVSTDGNGIFQGISAPFSAMRYHSLVVERQSLPENLQITATSDDGEIMGIRLRDADSFSPVEGIQFHPESIMTAMGKRILRNFLTIVERRRTSVVID